MKPAGGTAARAERLEEWVRPLGEVRLGDRLAVGGKAAVLGELLSRGMPVLPGVAITTAAYEAAAAEPEELGTMPLASELAATVGSALRELAIDGELIVRSSATAEDGASSSFAGQFASVHAAGGEDGLARAIAAVWASATAPHVADYQRQIGSPEADGTPEMGVLVQPYERFEVAGIMFSQHPTVRLRDWALVEFLDEAPDRIVSGEVTPHRVRLRMADGGLVWEHRAEGSADLSAEDALALARYAGATGELLDADVDMEWGRRAGEVLVLQARPATIDPWG